MTMNAERDSLAACGCTWCGRVGPQVVPLLAGRRGEPAVVGAICPACVLPRGAARPAGAALVAASVLAAAATCWVSSLPGGLGGGPSAVVAVAWVGVALAYGLRAWAAGRATRNRALAGLRSWRWAVPPLAGLVVAVAVAGGLPARARFMVSQTAIDRVADEAAAGVPTGGGRIGLLPVAGIRLSGATSAEVEVTLTNGCRLRRIAAPASDTASESGRHIGGKWWATCGS